MEVSDMVADVAMDVATVSEDIIEVSDMGWLVDVML
jgi:hypothetical protein